MKFFDNNPRKITRRQIERLISDIETWADEYDQEKVELSQDEFESIYDNSYFEAQELQKVLP